MSQANLSWADLSRATLSQADLKESNLTKALLGKVDLTEADLRGAALVEADLIGADAVGVRFAGADLTRVKVGRTVFHSVDLGKAKGLDTLQHLKPSVISIDTVFSSNAAIPAEFLRRSGVPHGVIQYALSLVGSTTNYNSCFISYATQDKDFADRLYTDLDAKGVACWCALHQMKSGKKIYEQIDTAIRSHDKLLLILSSHSMRSEWVKTEIRKAYQRELRDGSRVLFPISLVPYEAVRDWDCVDADTGKDTAREIREYFIPDFSNWNDHDSYQQAFEHLVRDLKVEEKYLGAG